MTLSILRTLLFFLGLAFFVMALVSMFTTSLDRVPMTMPYLIVAVLCVFVSIHRGEAQE